MQTLQSRDQEAFLAGTLVLLTRAADHSDVGGALQSLARHLRARSCQTSSSIPVLIRFAEGDSSGFRPVLLSEFLGAREVGTGIPPPTLQRYTALPQRCSALRKSSDALAAWILVEDRHGEGTNPFTEIARRAR